GPTGTDCEGGRRWWSAPAPRRHAPTADTDFPRTGPSPARTRRRRSPSGAGLNSGIAALPAARAPAAPTDRSQRWATFARAAIAHWAAHGAESTPQPRSATAQERASPAPVPRPAYLSVVPPARLPRAWSRTHIR